MSTKFELNAEPRDGKGTGASRRLRRASKIPAVIYGGDKAPDMVAFDHNTVLHLLEQEAFHTSILTVNGAGGGDQAILRDVQMHPFKPVVMHMDLQRVSATQKIHMSVPLHFIGEDTAPGVKTQGGIVSHQLNDVDITCLAADLPEFLPVDVSNMNIGDSLHLSDLQLPKGVEITALTHGGDDLAVVAIVAPRTAAEEEEAEGIEGEAVAGGEPEAEKEGD